MSLRIFVKLLRVMPIHVEIMNV